MLIAPFTDDTAGQPSVRGFLHTPATPSGDALVLTHSAGSNCRAPLLVAVASEFCEAGVTVLRCDLPFRQLRPTGPPPFGSAERDQQGLRRAVELMRPKVRGRIFLGGHSYGGRQASMLAAESDVASALLLLSYPLHPPNRPATLRTAHFPKLRTPALFVSGVKDGFATAEELNSALQLIPARTNLVSIEGAGHELMSKKNAATLPNVVVQEFVTFVGEQNRVGD